MVMPQPYRLPALLCAPGKGIKIVKGDVVASLEGADGKVGSRGGESGRLACGGAQCSHPPNITPATTRDMPGPAAEATCTHTHRPAPPCTLITQVNAAVLKSGAKLEASLVLVGVGARPNTDLFAGQLEMLAGPPGGIKTDEHLRVGAAVGQRRERGWASVQLQLAG